jgi:3-oxoacyl-[acyl-carrier protein] reductase
MVNNTGITRDASLRKMTEEQLDQVIGVHLRGCWLGTRAASGIMAEQGTGGLDHQCFLGFRPVGMPRQTSYSAAKAVIFGVTRAAAKESVSPKCASTPSRRGSLPLR